ncbi:MAG: chromosomal replication initiator protein DnaA [bacterium]|nr:chromosomal replication initiator protein DnaA [bacterium]MDZ4296181.1 chromosomal replication initiator protein DnaA [Patescibacteria group bacterium]
MDPNELWQTILAEIELQVSRAHYLTWFRHTSLALEKPHIATIKVPNGFTKEWLESKYAKFILNCLQNSVQDLNNVEFVIGKGNQASIGFPLAPPVEQPGLSGLDVNPVTNLNPRYTFDSFVVGSSNELAYAAARSVAKNPGLSYNPLFLYGGVGLGKTHLLQAIGNEVAHAKARFTVRYMPAEKLINDIVQAIQQNTIDQLKTAYRKIDLLIIDDIQFIAGKEKTQIEFFHVFNHLYQKNKQIVISSDRQPKAIPTLEERLQSRFEGGMIADVGPPDFETRVAILQLKLRGKNVALPDNIVHVIASHIQRNIRELEGALNQVLAMVHLTNTLPTLTSIEKILSKTANIQRRTAGFKQIIKTVAEFYDMKENDLADRSRKREVVRPRQVTMYLLRNEAKASFPFIGEKLGGRDHTTVMHAVQKIEREIDGDETLRQEVNLLRERLYTIMS